MRPVVRSRRCEKKRSRLTECTGSAGHHIGDSQRRQALACDCHEIAEKLRLRDGMVAGSRFWQRHESVRPRTAHAEHGTHLLPHLKAFGPMHGPSQTLTFSLGTPIARTVFSTTPEARPRHPACAAATTEPSSAASSTGMQSATLIPHTNPGCDKPSRQPSLRWRPVAH